ncbi:MAG: hypothetical protein JWO36_2486 [Myxococcales bacterium]|nr:hypothetical protein [Myxococcales bacterium]
MTLLSIGRPAEYVDIKSMIFDWQFKCNPHDDGRSPFLVGALDDETIVALNGYMPARIKFQGRPIHSCWSCDTYVSPSFRGRGFGKELVSRVSAAAPVMLGYGISDMSDPIFDKYDWLLHPHIDLLFFHVAEKGLAGRVKNLGSRLTRKRNGSAGSSSTVSHEEGQWFSGEVDALWTESRAGYFSTVERDAAYLNWKYQQHPLNRYTSYSLRSNARLRGVLIARHDPEESVIVDYCGPADDVRAMCELASAAVEDLSHRATKRIRCETTHPAMIEALKRAGFISSRYTSRFRVRSNESAIDPLKDWFLMPGDSDNDMLSQIERHVDSAH